MTEFRRNFLGRTDQYIRAAAMTNRLDELRRIHRWSDEEYNTASFLLSENMPIMLHEIGMWSCAHSQTRHSRIT
jgi:hypothetical protein